MGAAPITSMSDEYMREDSRTSKWSRITAREITSPAQPPRPWMNRATARAVSDAAAAQPIAETR